MAVLAAIETVRLSGVMPLPLEELNTSESKIWGQELSFSLKKRNLVSAESGKGKSTLVSLLIGLRTDYRGSITLGGKDSRSLSLDDWADLRKNQFSTVFQDLRLLLNYSVEENLALSRLLYQDYDRAFERRAIEALGIERLLNKVAAECSYGERQRVALVRALSRPYTCLLLDEPFSHLDEQNIRIATDLLQESLSNNKAGFLMASLGYQYAMKFDEIYLL